MNRSRYVLGVVAVALGGCALRSDVRRVEDELATFQAETARQDSIRAAQLSEIIQLQRRIMDSLAANRQALVSLQGDVANDLYNVQRQLVQLGELAGQSQRRLSELRAQLEARGEQIAAAAPTDSPPAADAGPAAPSAPSAEQMYEASVQQLRRGSTSTARMGLQQLLQTYPSHERVPDALYFIGESFSADNPDSAGAYYQRVVDEYPASDRAPTALYKLGIIAERRQDPAAAREAYQTVVEQYPNSDAAALARDRLNTLGQ